MEVAEIVEMILAVVPKQLASMRPRYGSRGNAAARAVMQAHLMLQ